MQRFDVDKVALVANRCGEPWLDIRREAPVDTEFALASSSKWISALGFLAARDAGVVDVDQPVGSWLVDLKPPRDQATIRQVLGHQSGYVGLHPCMGRDDIGLQDCARAIDTQPGSAPGQQFRYANAGFTVAAAALEHAAQRPFADAFDAHFLDPMGLEATQFGSRTNPNPAYGLTSTAGDYLAVLQMVLDGGIGPRGRVLSAASIDQMWTGQRRPRSGFVPPNLRGTPHPIYGLGVWLSHHDAQGTPTVASAQGRYGFQPWVDRERRIAAVYAVELGGPGNPDSRSSPPEVKAELARMADALPACRP